MHVIGHGIDLVECARIERIWQDHGPRFLERVYTPAERDFCLSGRVQVLRLAGRFAAKEAVMKVLGTGWGRGVDWTDVETLPDAHGRPHVALSGGAARHAAELGIRQMLISISHAGGFATASAIGVGD